MKKTKTAKLFGLAALAVIVLGTTACNLATSGFGTITMPGEWPEIPPLPEAPAEPPPVLPPPPLDFSLANEQGNDLWRWVVTADDTVIITGYLGPDGHVDIPSTLGGLPVASIARPIRYFPEFGDYAGGPEGTVFDVNSNITSVRIPAGLVSIGAGAFAGTQLTHVDIPYGVTSIGPYAFLGPRRNFWSIDPSPLSSVSIPGSVTHISEAAFATTQLTSVTIPASVTHIGDLAFQPPTGSVQGGLLAGTSSYLRSPLLEIRFLGSIPMLGHPMHQSGQDRRGPFPGNLHTHAPPFSGTFTREPGSPNWVRQP